MWAGLTIVSTLFASGIKTKGNVSNTYDWHAFPPSDKAIQARSNSRRLSNFGRSHSEVTCLDRPEETRLFVATYWPLVSTLLAVSFPRHAVNVSNIQGAAALEQTTVLA
jgi:hypothetical protein